MTLTGRLLKRDGKPLAQTKFVVMEETAPGTDEEPNLLEEAKTDAQGRFRVDGIPRGRLIQLLAGPLFSGTAEAFIVPGIKTDPAKPTQDLGDVGIDLMPHHEQMIRLSKLQTETEARREHGLFAPPTPGDAPRSMACAGGVSAGTGPGRVTDHPSTPHS